MKPSKRVLATVLASALAAILSVHYLEELLLPVVESARLIVYGDQSYTSALAGCDSLPPQGTWVHPASLALTVYGDAQAALAARFEPHVPEVLPGYAQVRRGASELVCVADYLLESTVSEQINGVQVRAFRFRIAHDRYGLVSGWVSGLAQGLVGQVFLASYLIGGDQKYLDAAKETGHLLAVAKELGGARVDLDDDSIWFEEYAQPGATAPLVLNGHLLAMDFLYWMRQVDDDELWRTLFDGGLRATVESIGRHQGFAWSYYDQMSNLATRKYHSFHIRQLDRYSRHDSSGTLGDAKGQMRWQLFVPLGIFQRLVTQPSRLIIVLAVLFFCLYAPVAWFVAGIGGGHRAGGRQD